MNPKTTLPDDIVDLVTNAIDQSTEDLTSLLQDLVRIRSVNPKLSDAEPGGEAKVQDYVAPILESIGCEIDRWEPLPGRPNQVGALRGSGGGHSLVINGHIDVVPVGDPDSWEHGPWSGDVVDGMLWGRGSLDMKGGVASMLHAARIINQLGFRLKGDLFLETVIDEETGGPGTRATIERGYRPDFALVAEPTNLIIMPVEGGLEWVRVIVAGSSAHAAGRFQSIHAGGKGKSVNAIEKAAKVLAAIGELEREWAVKKVHPLLPKGITTISPGVMAAGSGRGADGMPQFMTAIATIPDYCIMDFDLKYLPNEKTEDVRAEFEDYIARVANADSWLREHPPTIEWGVGGVSFPPADTPVDHPGVQALWGAAERVNGETRAIGFTAVSDLAWFAGEGIPSAIFGPGGDTGAHSEHEHIELSQVVAAAKIYALMMLEWCGYEQAS